MNRAPWIAFGVSLALAASWLGLVLVPQLQLGSEPMVVIEATGQDYPLARSGGAQAGAAVYRACGCAVCHTQQVRPAAEGGDLARGWGRRRTVARDYLRDEPPMLGSLRLGPDLANLGARETNNVTLLFKLYDARIATPGSTMPRFLWLFTKRRVPAGFAQSPEALPLPPAFAPPPGWEVVPTDDARALVAYLRSLQSAALFYEVFPPVKPRPATNGVAPVSATNTPPTR